MVRIGTISLMLFSWAVVAWSEQDTHFPQPAQIDFRIAYTTGTILDLNINDARAATMVLVDKLFKGLGIRSNAKTFILDDLSTIVRLFEEKELDLLSMLPEEYLELKCRVDVEPLVVPMADQRVSDSFLLLARKNDGIAGWSDLKQKRLIVESEGRGMLPIIWLDTMLWKNRLSGSDELFSEVKTVNQASQTVLPVFFGQADACIVSNIFYQTLVELNPQVGQELVEIARSPKYLFGIICCRMGFAGEYPSELVQSLTELHHEPYGKQLLTLFHLDQLVPFDKSYIENIVELLKEHDILCPKEEGR